MLHMSRQKALHYGEKMNERKHRGQIENSSNVGANFSLRLLCMLIKKSLKFFLSQANPLPKAFGIGTLATT